MAKKRTGATAPRREQRPRFVITRLSVLRLRPGDVVVVRSNHIVSYEEAAKTCALVREACGGARCIVLNHGVRLGLLRKASTRARGRR